MNTIHGTSNLSLPAPPINSGNRLSTVDMPAKVSIGSYGNIKIPPSKQHPDPTIAHVLNPDTERVEIKESSDSEGHAVTFEARSASREPHLLPDLAVSVRIRDGGETTPYRLAECTVRFLHGGQAPISATFDDSVEETEPPRPVTVQRHEGSTINALSAREERHSGLDAAGRKSQRSPRMQNAGEYARQVGRRDAAEIELANREAVEAFLGPKPMGPTATPKARNYQARTSHMKKILARLENAGPHKHKGETPLLTDWVRVSDAAWSLRQAEFFPRDKKGKLDRAASTATAFRNFVLSQSAAVAQQNRSDEAVATESDDESGTQVESHERADHFDLDENSGALRKQGDTDDDMDISDEDAPEVPEIENRTRKTAFASDSAGLGRVPKLRSMAHGAARAKPGPIRDEIASRFPAAFKRIRNVDNGTPLKNQKLSELLVSHRAMATMLDLVDDVRRARNLEPTPENMETLLRSGFDGMKKSLVGNQYGLTKFLAHEFEPKVAETFAILERVARKFDIAPAHLPKLLIDVKLLDMLEERGIPMHSNCFYPFLFDHEPGYLNRSAKTLDRARTMLETMNSVDDLTIDHLIELNAVCQGREDSEFITGSVSYTLKETDDELSTEGRKWISKYVSTLRREYKLDIVFSKEKSLSSTVGRPTWMLSRNGSNKTKLLTVMNDLLAEFKQSVKDIEREKLSPEAKADAHLLAAGTLGKKLEHLHPFRDANYRAICVCYLNMSLHLLGLRPTTFADSNTHDGKSPAELLPWYKKGWDILAPAPQQSRALDDSDDTAKRENKRARVLRSGNEYGLPGNDRR